MSSHTYGPAQDLSVIEETNAYCWVDIVVNTADAWVFLGRKIRTKKEGEADWAAGRRREFPSYVATPEGIRECWTKAEEEAAKKKVK